MTADRYALLRDVAHAAWHLMDDSGDTEAKDDNGVPEYMHSGLDHQRLSDALDALEAAGWDPHPPPPPPPSKQNGALLGCGHWTYKGVFPSQAVGQYGLCDVGDGRQAIVKCNVEEPDAHYEVRVHAAQDRGAS